MASSNENYPWPSTLNISNFVSVKLWLNDKETSTNYKIWREQMLCLLESQDLLGFINEEIQIPECGNGSPSSNEKLMKVDKHKLWRRTDRLVKGWILGSMGDDVLNALKGLNCISSSREVWIEVENILSQKECEIPSDVVDENCSGNLDFSKYLPLHQAAIRNDWKTAKTFFDQDKKAVEAFINPCFETALHASVQTGDANDFVKNLLDLMSNDALAIQSNTGTALHVAALVGNMEAVIMLVNKKPDLLYNLHSINKLPVHMAALFCRKDILSYLIVKCKENMNDSPFVGQLGINLLSYVIGAEFLDVALDLVKTYPDMATSKDEAGDAALSLIAEKGHLFPSGKSFNWWQNFIYSCIPLTSTPKTSYVGDIENLGINSQVTNFANEGFSNFKATVWSVVEYLVPDIKDIRHKKVLHKQAIELVKYLCQKLESWPGTEDSSIHKRSVIIAAANGNHEVVELIAEIFPLAIPSTWNELLSLTIQNRHENVYNVLYQINYLKERLSTHVDFSLDNLMHVSAKLAPPHKLNLIPGAALQMQRELQWFKEMENIIMTSHKTMRNKNDETPRMLFRKEHEDLKRQGEKWMKDTASSCSITAALIVTVVFAAAFTVPGGIDSNTGIPIFWDKTPFILFAISDIISLFSSVTSLLMFLSILTSRYAEEDFLHSLPRRLCMGLFTLFISITFMMVAFSATAYLTFRQKIGSLLIIPVAALACLPVVSFALLQFPILVDVAYATYGPGIFHKKSDRSLY